MSIIVTQQEARITQLLKHKNEIFTSEYTSVFTNEIEVNETQTGMNTCEFFPRTGFAPSRHADGEGEAEIGQRVPPEAEENVDVDVQLRFPERGRGGHGLQELPEHRLGGKFKLFGQRAPHRLAVLCDGGGDGGAEAAPLRAAAEGAGAAGGHAGAEGQVETADRLRRAQAAREGEADRGGEEAVYWIFMFIL